MPRRPTDPNQVNTTVRLPKDMLHRARVRAAKDDTTITALLAEGLELVLDRRDTIEQRRTASRATAPRAR